MNILIIGGVAGGATAAARIRRNDENARIVMVERGPYISFANCGLPYHLSGMIAEREQLLVSSKQAVEARYAVDVRVGTEAIAIDRKAKTVRLRELATGEEYDEPYDRLLLAPGAEPIRPQLPGIASKRAFTLRNVPDLDRIMARLDSGQTRRAVVIGGGFIGLELAESLHERGLSTTVVEGADQVLAPLDPEMAAIISAHLHDKNVALHLADRIEGLEDRDDHTVVRLSSGKQIPADIVILAMGVRPETTLARACGLELGDRGGIKVNEFLQSSDEAIYAVGDAIEVTQFVGGHQTLIPLAGPANRQGRIAADNIAFGNTQAYRGTLGTSILKVFDLAAATTGMNEKTLIASGIDYRTSVTHGNSHAGYYPGAMPLTLKLLYSPEGQILGAQVVGADGVDKRIDVIATAIRGGLKVEELADLELAYAPPFGSAKDVVNIAGYVASNVLHGSLEVLDWRELAQLAPGSAQLIDVRTAEEFGLGSIPGAKNVDLDQLRARLGELDPLAPTIVFCQLGARGYLAYRILRQSGFSNVRNLSGGYKTYSIAMEKPSHPALVEQAIKPREMHNTDPHRGCAVPPESARRTLDTVGLQCPGPIMKTYRAVEAMGSGELLEVKASDPAFGRDIKAWAGKTGNEVLSVTTEKGVVTALIRKSLAPAPSALPGATAKQKTTLVVFSDDLDKVMASLIIANGALAMGKPVSIFFTFWGLNVLRRADAPRLGKPFMDRMFGAMMPTGISKLNSITKMNFGGLGARLIRKVMRNKGVQTPETLLKSLVDGGAQLIACTMSMDVMGIRKEELIDEVELGGVAAFLGEAQESATTLFI